MVIVRSPLMSLTFAGENINEISARKFLHILSILQVERRRAKPAANRPQVSQNVA
jgi:hypothetical protein